MKHLTSLLIVIMLVFLSVTNALSQQTEYASGEVASISTASRQIALKVYNSDQSISQVNYTITNDAKLKNIESLNEIAISDYVDLTYTTQDDGTSLVSLIKVFKLEG